MKKYGFCEKCHRRKKMTRHHLLPRRFFNGGGPKAKLCRDCHDALEDIIPQNTKLSVADYELIYKDFLAGKLSTTTAKEKLFKKLGITTSTT